MRKAALNEYDISPEWVREIDGEPTFCGALEKYFDEIAIDWNENTQIKYKKQFDNIIFPHLSGHNNRTIDQYEKEDFDKAIQTIIEKGYGKDGDTYTPYADATIQHFRYIIGKVEAVAAKNKGFENVLWGSLYSEESFESETAQAGSRVRLQKSLTIRQEKILIDQLMTDEKQRGQEMGLLLMFALGLRNGEACGANYGDILPMPGHPDTLALWVYKSTKAGTNILDSSGKTPNADRIIPLPDRLIEFLEKRREFLNEQISFPISETIQSIDNLPIACLGMNYTIRCSAARLTAAGRELLHQTKSVEEKQLAFIENELLREGGSEEVRDKDPSAYLFRRNFGTHLSILGLSEAEIEYIIGHDIEDPYETRNEFVSEEKLCEIKKKLNQRPLFNNADWREQAIKIPAGKGKEYVRTIPGPQKIILSNEASQVKVRVKSMEPEDAIGVEVIMNPHETVLYSDQFLSVGEGNEGRTISVLKKYHELYDS